MNETANLDNIELFKALDSAARSRIAPLIDWRNYTENQQIIAHEEASSQVFFLAEGRVRTTTFSANGKEICFQHLETGDMFGELSAIDKQPRSTSVIAQTDCTVGMMQADKFWQLMEIHPEVMAGVMKRITGLVRFLCSRVYEYGALGTRERTRAEIIRLAKQHMDDDKSATIIDMPTHEDIANRIASHREAVTKEFSYLTRLGLIERVGKGVYVPDIHALSATVIEEIL